MPAVDIHADHFSELRTRAAQERSLSQPLADELRARFGDAVSFARAVRAHHGTDISSYATTPPDAVVFARSTDDVVDAVRACARHGVPVIPYGTGTSVEGHVLASQGWCSRTLHHATIARARP